MKYKKHKKRILICLLALIVVVLILNIVIISININNKNDKKEIIALSAINVSFSFSKTAGFAIEDQYLNFGNIIPNSHVKKRMALMPVNEPLFVHIVFSDNIKKYMYISNNDFIISPENESIELEFRAYNLDNLTQGNYTGNAYIYYFRP